MDIQIVSTAMMAIERIKAGRFSIPDSFVFDGFFIHLVFSISYFPTDAANERNSNDQHCVYDLICHAIRIFHPFDDVLSFVVLHSVCIFSKRCTQSSDHALSS